MHLKNKCHITDLVYLLLETFFKSTIHKNEQIKITVGKKIKLSVGRSVYNQQKQQLYIQFENFIQNNMINSLCAFTSALLFMSLLDCFRAGGYSVGINIQ